MFALEGGSFGLQIGGEATDFVLLVMNEKGAASVMSSKVKLGADASAAAGPVGRTTSAETDVLLKAEILSWSRARAFLAASRWMALRCDPMMVPTSISTSRNSAPSRSYARARSRRLQLASH